MKTITKDLIAASSIPIILSLLEQEGESYGYAIIKQVKELSGGKLIFSDGTLYPILRKLEQQELIESFWRVAENGRRRKYYRIKESGQKRLAAEQQQWHIIHQTLNKLWNNQNPNLNLLPIISS
ncbi:MAG: PadR family transcriptional regulator [Chitinophagales bacterium]